MLESHRALTYVIDALVELRLSPFASHDAVMHLPRPSQSLLADCYAIVSDFFDHGFRGYEWPTYVDLEILFALRCFPIDSPAATRILREVDLQMDQLAHASFGLLPRLSQIEAGFPSELPITWRAGLLRALLLRHIDRPARLRRLPQIIYEYPGRDLQDWEEAFARAHLAAIQRRSEATERYHASLGLLAFAIKE